MKNKLFLSLSLLTAAFTGLNVQAHMLQPLLTIARSNIGIAAEKLSPATQNVACVFGLTAVPTGLAYAMYQSIPKMTSWIPGTPFNAGEGYVVEAPVVVIPTPTKFEQFKTMLNNAGTSTLKMVNTNTATKVATGAAIAAVTGFVAYKSYKALVGQAVKAEPVVKTVKARRSTSSTPAPVTKKTVKRFRRK